MGSRGDVRGRGIEATGASTLLRPDGCPRWRDNWRTITASRAHVEYHHRGRVCQSTVADRVARFQTSRMRYVGGKRSSWVERAPPTYLLASGVAVLAIGNWTVLLSTAV